MKSWKKFEPSLKLGGEHGCDRSDQSFSIASVSNFMLSNFADSNTYSVLNKLN